MKLWLISQSDNADYDTYDGAVVAAETEQAAQETHPTTWRNVRWIEAAWRVAETGEKAYYADWADEPGKVSVEYLGEAKPDTEAGVICSSFNAG